MCRPQELAKYEYMEDQVVLTEKGNKGVAGEKGEGTRYLFPRISKGQLNTVSASPILQIS